MPKKEVMVSEGSLIREEYRIISHVEKYVRLVGTEKKDEVLQLFDKMFRFFPHWSIMSCPVMHPDFHYASQNCSQVFGYSKQYVSGISKIDKFFSHVHPNDQEDLSSCFSYLHNFLANIPWEEHQIYRCILHYRFRKSNGQYIYLHDEKASLNLNNAGNFYYALFRDITNEKTFNGVKIEIFRLDDTLNKIEEYKPTSQRNPLSKRESELVTLIKQGLSTKEIAWHLKISHHTVRNIKSKLFEKYNVNNTIELLNMTG